MAASLKLIGGNDGTSTDVLLCFRPGSAGYNASWFGLTDIYWDPQAGNDNAGGTIGVPVKTWAEILRRYGSDAPTMNYGQSVTVHQLTAQAANVDPVSFAPKMSGGGQAVLLGTLIANGAPFSPATVTAKNRATGQLLVLNTVPGGVVAKNLVHNTTSALAGWAFVDSVAGGNATMGQPIANTTIATVGIPTTTADNAWANTDTYQAYTLPKVNLKEWRPSGGDLTGGACLGWVQNFEVADASGAGTGSLGIVADAITVFSACIFDAGVTTSSIAGRSGFSFSLYMLGCFFTQRLSQIGGFVDYFGGNAANGITLNGGVPNLDGDMIVHVALALSGSFTQIGAAYTDNTVTLTGSQIRLGTSLWGTGGVVLNPGCVFFNASGTTFALSLQTTGALKLGTATTGTAPSVGGTFVLNGIVQVNVAPAGGQHFPANALIAWSLNTVGATPGVIAPYFSAAQVADQFSVKSGTALANDTYNWRAFGGSVSITPANLDLYAGLYDEATGARFCNTTGPR
jgi:hypothetical protein